jgi:[ribosomal protein S5]-alanine N-acetyltransferase
MSDSLVVKSRTRGFFLQCLTGGRQPCRTGNAPPKVYTNLILMVFCLKNVFWFPYLIQIKYFYPAMHKKYKTKRLTLKRLSLRDAPFLFDLLNTEGWIKFIGDRNIKKMEDAQDYTQKVLGDPNIAYWVVKSRTGKLPVGLISFIKRDYLTHYDLGFAFLPSHTNHGYAFEAADCVLKNLSEDPNHRVILATTRPDNIRSVKLLEKLGFHLTQEIENEQVTLLLYSFQAG